MRRLIINMVPAGIFFMLCACYADHGIHSQAITIYPDSVLNDLSNKPIGMNLNFLMDGGRFPDAEQSVAQAMKKMGMKYLRYPGGEKSDLYLFSVPPYDHSRPTPARTAGLDDYPGMFTGDHDFRYDPLDFDEYIALCREVRAEPVVVVAADYYLIDLKEGETVTPREKLIEHAAAWVRYANIQKKYGIRYWMIGNESWNRNNQNSTVEIYARDVVDFASAMKAVDPSILIIPNGNSDGFIKTVIETAGDYIDRICVSNYGVRDFNRGYDTYRDSSQCLIRPAFTAVNAMNRYASPLQLKTWKVIVAEFGTIDWAGNWKGENDMGHAIVTFDMAGQLLQQPQIEFSCYWNTRWIENEYRTPDHDVLDKNGNILPTGKALSIWANYMGKEMVKTESGNPLVTFATYTPEKGQLYCYIINKTADVQSVRIEIYGYKIRRVVEGQNYYGQDPEDQSPVWEEIDQLSDLEQKNQLPDAGKIDLKGYSISVYEFEIEKINKNDE